MINDQEFRKITEENILTGAIAAQSKNSNVETISENTIAKCDLKNILLPEDEDNTIKHPSEISFSSGGVVNQETLQKIQDRLYFKYGVPKEVFENINITGSAL